ncbi:PDR/VanB family oxidoreductase [Bacillus massiliigorillae]|uniref:PDR/VanB family oxidoreductase n=1 Tax=Bacillus massiliigorillae TaxID=1243664 RepID=UPI00039C611F|nr:PDR/VanB family oxidoreductase [Bacillus massiliigorillae]
MRVAGNIKVCVEKIVPVTETIKRFEFRPVDGKPLPAFTGGSHITTFVANGNEVIERHYSLVSNPVDRSQYAISIRRDEQSKGGSIFWHDNVNEGDHLEVSFPKNHFPLSYEAKHHVFYAAGIGITPFLTMMADLKAEGKSFELHYAAKSKELCAYYDYINENYPGVCTFYFSQEEGSSRMTSASMAEHRIGSHVYFCGPVSMVNEYREAAEGYGYPIPAIHFELFAAAEEGPRNPFVVELASSKKEIQVPEGATLLETLLKEGIDAPYSCKIGGCGSCELEVVDGEVDHRDSFYRDEERKDLNSILTCCSRAKEGKLVLNI